MTYAPSAAESAELHALIGDIYDAAIEPARWPAVLERLRGLLTCANAVLYVFDTSAGVQRLSEIVGIAPEWAARMAEYAPHIDDLFSKIDGEARYSAPGSMFVLQRDVPADIARANLYYREWATPQGIDDAIQLTLFRERKRLSLLAMGRFRRDGPIGEREIALLDLLYPHLRRAVAVADLLDMRSMETEAFAATLDLLSSAVVLVDEAGRVLWKNAAAGPILAASGVGEDAAGRLKAADTATNRRLAEAIERGFRSDPLTAPAAVPLTPTEGPLHLAYILPLAQQGRAVAPRATAAVFVAPADAAPADLTPIGEAFGLTPAEIRLLQQVARGDSVAEAAEALGIGRNTSRTHMARILNKTGMPRQAALVALVHRLAPGLREGAAMPRKDE
jgi:DNA-binding CsgD family transcriptional regulator